MSLSVTPLYTHWDADEAYLVIQFLDRLREQLIETYGDEIIDMLKATNAITMTTVVKSNSRLMTTCPFDRSTLTH